MAAPSHVKKARFDVSLVRLTQQFMELVSEAPDGVLDINDVARMLGVRKRRVYDITNVLDGIHLVRKKSKNRIEWIGKNPQETLGYEAQSRKLKKELADLTTVEDSLDELIKDCAHQLYKLTDDKENETIQVYIKSTEGPIDVFVCEMQEENCPKKCTDDTSSKNKSISSATDETVTLPPDKEQRLTE
ncbi:transcription factor E2F6 isoform X2 [Rhinoraja longicauda]